MGSGNSVSEGPARRHLVYYANLNGTWSVTVENMKLHFNLSAKRIQEAVKEGIVLTGKMSIDVDLEALSASDREVLSRNIEYNHNADAFFVSLLSYEHTDSHSTLHQVCSEKIAEIIQQMKDLELKREQYKEKQKAGLIAEINEFLTGKTMRVLGTGIYPDYSGSFDYKELRAKYEALGLQSSPAFEEIESKAKQYEQEQQEDKSKRAKVAAEKAAAEAAKKAALDAGREALLTWAKENGSDLLKLRIKHEQNWQEIAETEWAKAHVSEGFEPWDFNPDSEKDWTVNNATLKQLQVLNAVKEKNPQHKIDIMRSRWIDEENEDYIHRTFLRCEVKTPVGYISLYKQINDVTEE